VDCNTHVHGKNTIGYKKNKLDTRGQNRLCLDVREGSGWGMGGMGQYYKILEKEIKRRH
jgi:hypothetical protein